MLPNTTDRVRRTTDASINRAIERATERSIRHHAEHPERITDRLHELDREWDIERTLEANAATVALVGVVLAAFVDRRFLVLPAVVAGFLLQHALQGWCPPVPVLRRLGVRTEGEIDRERYALKALRGDFDEATHPAPRERRARAAFEAVAGA
jgi:hypothetical protein